MKTTILKTLLCTGVFILALSSTTLAETPVYTEEPSKTMEISLNIPASYTWSVPSSITFNSSESEKTFAVTIDDLVISPEQSVNVSVTFANSNYYDLNNGAYVLKDEDVVANTNQFLYKVYSEDDNEIRREEKFITTSEAVTKNIKIKLLEGGSFNVAGNYKSRLVFTSTIS